MKLSQLYREETLAEIIQQTEDYERDRALRFALEGRPVGLFCVLSESHPARVARLRRLAWS